MLGEDIVVCIVGNKIDLREKQNSLQNRCRKVSPYLMCEHFCVLLLQFYDVLYLPHPGGTPYCIDSRGGCPRVIECHSYVTCAAQSIVFLNLSWRGDWRTSSPCCCPLGGEVYDAVLRLHQKDKS